MNTGKTTIWILALLAGGFLFQNCQSETPNNSVTQTQEEESTTETVDLSAQAVAPPFEGIDVPYQNFTVSAEEDQVLELENGTSIEIPANAFVDQEGKPVKGIVDIKYREFHTVTVLVNKQQ